MTESEVIGLLTNDVPPARVEELARQYGISFEVTSETERKLRDAGATDDLLRTLRELAPKPAARPATHTAPNHPSGPATLMIESTPGGAEVYLDDAPVGTTSPEGRLKLPQLAPGEHTVRLSLQGYRDYEEKVTLAAGQTQGVAATLGTSKPATQPAASLPASSSATPAQPTSVGPSGSLGLMVRRSPGGQGMVVAAVIPDGPAQQAGLRRGYTVVSIAGHNLEEPADLQKAMAGHPPGEAVEVTYSNGAGLLTARAQLVSSTIWSNVPRFRVIHDHGPPAPNYCFGWITIIGGMILYDGERGVTQSGSTNSAHTFDIPLNAVWEAKRNAVYLVQQGAFHIRLKKGTNYNFVVINTQGKYQPPDMLLQAIDQARGRY